MGYGWSMQLQLCVGLTLGLGAILPSESLWEWVFNADITKKVQDAHLKVFLGLYS